MNSNQTTNNLEKHKTNKSDKLNNLKVIKLFIIEFIRKIHGSIRHQILRNFRRCKENSNW